MLYKACYLSNDMRKRLANEESSALFIISSGRIKLVNRLSHTTEYPSRHDYQLLYVRSGQLHYIDKNSTEQTAPKGSFLFYKPGEYQKYWTFLKEKPDIYWCHFTGVFAKTLLENYNLYDKRIISVSSNKKFHRIYDNMRITLEEKNEFFLELNNLFFQQLIVSISSEIHNGNSLQNLPNELKNVLNYIHEHYNENISVVDLAKLGYSNSVTLTRQFNKYMNCSPKKYLNQYRIEKAKSFLLHSNIRINEIATAVGFKDPLYFSSVFHKATGLSPIDFKDKH